MIYSIKQTDIDAAKEAWKEEHINYLYVYPFIKTIQFIIRLHGDGNILDISAIEFDTLLSDQFISDVPGDDYIII